VDVHFDEGAIFDLLNGSDGPVWQLVNELSEEAAVVARGIVRVRTTPTWSSRSNAQAVGATLASISAHMGYDSQGHVYGGVNAIENPTIFLEYPRVDRMRYPFLTTAVWSLEGTLGG
jgi:hypothetical protein